MARGKSNAGDDMVLVRIRRMGQQWATCGIGVRPPEHLVGRPGMKALCPKLVPGQCRRLPRNHPILKPGNSELVEIVSAPRADEFECPWVFATAEDAVRANPSRSHLSADQIAEALALTEGATYNQRKKLDKRERQREENENTDDYDDRVRIQRDDDEGEELEDDGDGEHEDVNARRSQNRHIREEDEEGGEEQTGDEETRPRRRRRPGRQPS